MSYSSGGTIAATDYNNLAWGGTQGTYTSSPNNVAYVMGVGSGQFGYGQDLSLINTVSTAATVTAVQWAGLFLLTNRALGHQGGTQIAAGNLNATSGQTITYFSNVATAVTSINTNKASYGSQGTTITGSNFTASWTNAATTSALVFGVTRTVTFASGDAARYFFNAGGQINLVMSGTNNDGSNRSGDVVTLLGYVGTAQGLKATTFGGRTGTGGTGGTVNTSNGYYNLPNAIGSQVNLIQNIYSTASTYNGDYIYVNAYNSTTNASGHGDNGVTINLSIGVYLAAKSLSFNESVNVTVTHRVDIIPPESTYLTNSWGTPTIA